MSIKEVIEIFGKEKVIKWISDIPNFYLRPTTFFRKLFIKSHNEKFLLAVFYTVLAILFAYVFSKNDFRTVTKMILIEIAVLAIIFGILQISNYISSKIYSYKVDIYNVFLFLLLTKLLTMPIQLVFLKLFENTEMYEFLFIHYTIQAFLICFVLLYSSKIFYRKKKQLFLSIFINLLLYNIVIICSVYIRFDKYENNYEIPILTDSILKEYEENILVLDSLAEYPKSKYLIRIYDTSGVIYSFKSDSLKSILPELTYKHKQSNLFQQKLLITLLKERDLRKKLKFERNKILYDSVSNYLNVIKSDIYVPIDTSNTFLIAQTTLTNNKGANVGNVRQVTISPNFIKKYNQYVGARNNFYEAAEIAHYPKFIIYALMYPALTVVNYKNKQPVLMR